MVKINQIKTSELAALLSAGNILVIGEYRGGKGEVIPYTDKKGNSAKFCKITHKIEIGEQTVMVSEAVEERDASGLLEWKPTIAKGTKVAVVLKARERFGVVNLDGYCCPLDVKS